MTAAVSALPEAMSSKTINNRKTGKGERLAFIGYLLLGPSFGSRRESERKALSSEAESANTLLVMAEEPIDSERPPDEAWWERELHRNEKLMDKYMAVLGDNPDWDKWKNPDDLYNKVHFDIDPPQPDKPAEEVAPEA